MAEPIRRRDISPMLHAHDKMMSYAVLPGAASPAASMTPIAPRGAYYRYRYRFLRDEIAVEPRPRQHDEDADRKFLEHFGDFRDTRCYFQRTSAMLKYIARSPTADEAADRPALLA